MSDIKIISEWNKKNYPKRAVGNTITKVAKGYKRVQAIVGGVTKHIDVKE